MSENNTEISLNELKNVLKSLLKAQYCSSNILYDHSNTGNVVVFCKNGNDYNNYKTTTIQQIDTFFDNVITKLQGKISTLTKEEQQNTINDFKQEFVNKIYSGALCGIDILGVHLSIPFVMFAKLQNGKIIERTFGIKESGQQYTPEEIKVILKEAQENENKGKKFKDGRPDKFTFLSMIVDMIDESIGENSKNPIRFITPDNDDKDKVYKEIKQIINKTKQDHLENTPPNILLIPYSADGHIVTLLVDKREFPNRNSVVCFDSSHYFTGYIGWIKERFGREGKPFKKKHFSNDLLYTLDAHQKPINKGIIQKWSGTCSFYTEAFCYMVSDYIQENHDVSLDDIIDLVNSPLFEKSIKLYKEEFLDQYKATMEKVEQKQKQQKENIKQEIIKYKKQSSSQNEQLTPDEQHYQQLLNQYGICMYGQEFMDDINGIDGINNSNPFNPDQQNALVQEFIDSEILNKINQTIPVLSRFAHFDDAGRENIAQDKPYNFIFTTGVGSNMNQRGTHYVAGQIFRHPITNELVILHYDSLNGTMSDEFERYIRNEFRENIQQIINISNHNRFTQQEQGAYTCGLCALTALRDNGILDQGREYIIEHNLSQVTNLDIPNIQQQTPNTPTLPIIEESPNTSQFSPHSITPSKTSSEQSISSSSSSTTEHSQTPQQQTPTQSQNSQSTQSQLQQSQIISSLVITQANNVSHNESSQQSTPPQTPISPPSNSSSLSNNI